MNKFKDHIPSGEQLAAIYGPDYVHFSSASSGWGPQEINGARHKLNRCRRMADRVGIRALPALLDVGCGAGTFVSIARGISYCAEGIDLFLPEERSEMGLRRIGLDAVESASYDLITVLNVAEHLIAPVEFFSHALRILRRPGLLLLTCPNGSSLARRWYKEHWIHAMPAEHLLFWTPGALTSMLRRIGFDGPVSCHVGGSPFPFGRARSSPTTDGPTTAATGQVQRSAWRLARMIQTRKRLASAIRLVVHATRTGDYLEYIIAVT